MVELNRAVIAQEVDKLMYLRKTPLPLRVRYIDTPDYVKRPISNFALDRSIAELKVLLLPPAPTFIHAI